MAGLKADIEKELKSLGIRHVSKQGYGEVPLGQCKTEELLSALQEAKNNKK